MNLYLISYLTFCFVYIIIYIFCIYNNLYSGAVLLNRIGDKERISSRPLSLEDSNCFFEAKSSCATLADLELAYVGQLASNSRDWPTSAPQIAGIKGIATMAGPRF